VLVSSKYLLALHDLIKVGKIRIMLKKIKNLIIIFTLFVSTLFVCAPLVYAQTGCQNGDANACLNDPSVSGVMKYAKLAVNILSGLIIIIATIMVIVGGITYTTSNGDPQKVQKAKTMIANVIVGIAAYFFLWAFLQWLIPGGVFNK
jgi:hypothetical protein